MRTEWASPADHRNTMRHWSLIRMLWYPLKLPRRGSRRLPGGDIRSWSVCAALIMSNFRSATDTISEGKRRTAFDLRPWYRSSVARFPKDAITRALLCLGHYTEFTDTV